MAIEIFTRKEQKYLISMAQYEELVFRMSPYMRVDKNGVDGCYTVTSLYFESPDHRIYYETKNKLPFRQKLRLRVYDDTNLSSTAFFEVKQKYKKVVNKRRMLLPLYEAYRYLSENGNDVPIEDYESSNSQVLREIDHFRKLYNLRPDIIVSYDRKALHGMDDDELRVTFDFNLRCRKEDLLLENGPYGDHFIDTNVVVLEVKVNHSVPLWLTRLLQTLACEQRGASKYCTSMELSKQEELPTVFETEKLVMGGV